MCIFLSVQNYALHHVGISPTIWIKCIKVWVDIGQNVKFNGCEYFCKTLYSDTVFPNTTTECGASGFVSRPLDRAWVQAARFGPLLPEHHHAPGEPGSTLWYRLSVQLVVQLWLCQLQPVQHWWEEKRPYRSSTPTHPAKYSCTSRSVTFLTAGL